MTDFHFFGLPSRAYKAIYNLFSRHPSIEKIIIYGSRAKGNYRYNSDIDLTIVGKEVSLTELLKIENELDDLLLPYTIDLSLYHQINNPALIEHIERVGAVFYKR